jgi:hypothetical protein
MKTHVVGFDLFCAFGQTDMTSRIIANAPNVLHHNTTDYAKQVLDITL